MKTEYLLYRTAIRYAAVVLALIFAIGVIGSPQANGQILPRQISQDSFTNGTSQHMTEVEPSAFSNGQLIVAAFQVGRIYGGGGADIGWATFADTGAAGTWTNGYLPGLTQWEGGGPNSAASDPVVAWNAKYHQWLISTLPIGNSDLVAVSRSSDGINWNNPIYVITSGDADKNWLTCDNWPSSPYYGNCYQEWDSPALGDELQMSTSTDGGLTWGTTMATGNSDAGIGGQPVILPNGNVVVTYADFNGGMSAFISTNGGHSWGSTFSVSSAPSHGEAGGLRSAGLPSVAQDGAGTVYLSWSDCRFRSGCNANDIVYTTSTDGTHWTSVVRVPIDPVTSTVDHFINGLGIDPATSGNTAHIGLTYYFYPNTNCSFTTCRLIAGFIQSSNGGNTWSYPRQVSSQMQMSWLPNTFSGYMVADYVATAFVHGKAYPIFSDAYPVTGSTFHQAIYTTALGTTSEEGVLSSANDKAIPNAKSDHPIRTFYEDNERPLPSGQTAPPDPDRE